jgi:phosphatidylglycerol:prolipoprotein diacylglycerol transferase
MYPELFTIFGYTVSTFGLMLATAFLVGSWITGLRMAEEGLDAEKATSILIYVILGGILGSKLYYAVDVSLREDRAFFDLFFARDGITWYGGLLMATAIGAVGCRIHEVPVKVFADCTAVAGAIGQAIGRVGCFLVGDDYGRVTDVPWGVEFPRGAPPTHAPVHPTQLYEIAWLLPVAGFLWWRRKRSPFLFGEYLALNGLGRIVIENWRVNPKVALGMTEPQWIGAGLIAVGLGGWAYFRRRGSEPHPKLAARSKLG